MRARTMDRGYAREDKAGGTRHKWSALCSRPFGRAACGGDGALSRASENRVWQCHRVLPPDPLVESERDSAVVLWHFSGACWCSHRDSNPDFCVESAAAWPLAKMRACLESLPRVALGSNSFAGCCPRWMEKDEVLRGSPGRDCTCALPLNRRTPTANIGPLNKWSRRTDSNRCTRAYETRAGATPVYAASKIGGQCRIRTGPFGLQDQRAAANTNRPYSKFGLSGLVVISTAKA